MRLPERLPECEALPLRGDFMKICHEFDLCMPY
jgi:hypothetical protein